MKFHEIQFDDGRRGIFIKPSNIQEVRRDGTDIYLEMHDGVRYYVTEEIIAGLGIELIKLLPLEKKGELNENY